MANPHVETTATVEHPAGGAEHGEAAAFGVITAPMFIALAMIVVIALIFWKKVPAAIGKALDSKIDVIRNQLAEAESLRKDAEALKVATEAKTQAALDTEKRLKVIDEQIGARVSEAEGRIRDAAEAARRELEPVAAEAASQLVTKLTGQAISAKDAEPAVKAVLHG